MTNHYELLAQCIRSEQLDSKQVDIVMQDAEFAAWYKLTFDPSISVETIVLCLT